MFKKLLSALGLGRDASDDLKLEVVKKMAATQLQAEKDAQVLASLAANGDSGTTPRPTTFYFYGGDQSRLRQAALAHGFNVKPTVAAGGSVLTKTLSVDAGAFSPVSEQMVAWADAFGCEYDGWETVVARGRKAALRTP